MLIFYSLKPETDICALFPVILSCINIFIYSLVWLSGFLLAQSLCALSGLLIGCLCITPAFNTTPQFGLKTFILFCVFA